MASSPPYRVQSIFVEDLRKPPTSSNLISTGIGFFDHMLDQFNSHAQIGVALTVVDENDTAEKNASIEYMANNRNRYTANMEDPKQQQDTIMTCVGTALGKEIYRLLLASETTTGTTRSTFSCPLDEGLVECGLVFGDSRDNGKKRKHDNSDNSSSGDSSGNGELVAFHLAPYGKHGDARTGRRRIGQMETASLEQFWQAVAHESHLRIALRKKRGDNAHHIVESTFKAFARALRNLLDGTDTTLPPVSAALDDQYGPESRNWKESLALQRQASVERTTKETSIKIKLALDGGQTGIKISTGITMLDEFFVAMFTECQLASCHIACPSSDLWIDEHHTAEDISIALGQVMNQCLGNKAGLNRMWCSTSSLCDDESPVLEKKSGADDVESIECVIDLSNRPCLIQEIEFCTTSNDSDDGDDGIDKCEDLSFEMFEHVLDSFVVNARWSVHILHNNWQHGDKNVDSNAKNKAIMLATARAMGRAMRYCCAVDSRRAGATASSKGTLSV